MFQLTKTFRVLSVATGLSLLNGAPVAVAHPCENIYSLQTASRNERFQFQLEVRTAMRLRLALGESFRIDQLKLNVQKPNGLFSLYYGGEMIGVFNAYLRGATLKADITVHLNFRGQKLRLYEEWLRAAVISHPEVQYLPSDMPQYLSDNATFFFSQLFGESFEDLQNYRLSEDYGADYTHGLKDLPAPLELPFKNAFLVEKTWTDLSASQGVALRNRLLDIFDQMPSTKARKSVGFGRVKAIHVTLGTLARQRRIAFITEKGAALARDPFTQIVVSFDGLPSRHWELDSGGLVRQLSALDWTKEYPEWADYKVLESSSH